MSMSILPGDSRSWGRLILGILLLVAVLFAIRSIRGVSSGLVQDPERVLVNYLPADFSYNLDEEYALAVLTHPYRYREDFDRIVRGINEALLDHTARRMGLSDSLRVVVINGYESHHEYLSELYFKDFTRLRDSSATQVETWYENQNTGAVDAFLEVASKYTCFLTSHVITTALGKDSGVIMGVGKGVEAPCSVALQEGLNPMMKRLRERASIQDFSESRGLLQEKVETLISELATLEIQDKKGLNKQLQTEVLGFKVSTTDITVTAISILKVGFDLNERFELELDPNRKVVEITLPEPKILSHEVYPRLENLSIGWLRELQGSDLNKAFNALRAEFRREAMEEGAFDRSKAQAEEVMQTLFSPLVAAINPSLKIRVQYKPAARAAVPYQSRLND